MTTETIPQGYKQTEIGVIPEDWEDGTLSELTESDGLIRGPFGGSLKKEFFVKRGLKVYEQKNAIYRDIELGDYYIDQNKFMELKRFEVKSGDFIVSCSGTIGRIYLIPKNAPQGIINQALLIIRLNSSIIDKDYFFQYFDWEKFQDKIIDSTQGGAMKNLVGMDVFRKTKVALPKSKQEQSAIATALSQTDELIQHLNKLISKKKDIKKGAMQELLTGKKRLPGFSGEWEEKKLGDFTDIKTGKKNNEDKIEEASYPFFVRSQNVERINSYSFDGEAILVPGEGGVGSIFHYINGKFDYHQRVYKISNFGREISGKFIYYYMLYDFHKQATKNSVKATVDSLRLPTFQEFELKIPNDQKEQSAIASILSDMDSEIEQLEQKRNKYQMIKEGMMQQLLTGRIRLKWK
ncbi:MAG: restriction endonuclease subunit S [Candidatus Pacearchaeota archaeon]